MRRAQAIGWRRLHAGLLAALALLAAVTTFAACGRLARGNAPLPSPSVFSQPDAWAAYGGDWAATATEIHNNSQERGAKLMTRAGAWGDYQVQADLQIAEPYGEAGLMIRSSGEEEGVDAYHGYFAGIRTMDASFEFGRADFGWHALLHRRLPEGADLQRPIHLRLAAVGCRFAIALALADGRVAGGVADDPDCLRTGRFGLRSYLTSVTWRNLSVSPAGPAEIAAIEQQLAGSPTPASLASSEPYDALTLDRYATAMRAEAKKHAVQPGVQPIVSFLMQPGRHPHVTIQGVIISTPPLTAIQDDTNALIIPNLDPHSTVKLGDVVAAEGTVVSERFRSRIDDAKIRVLWSDTEIPPLAVTASQLTSGTYRGRSIEVEGILKSVAIRPGDYDLVLQDGGQSFRALGSKNFQIDPAGLVVGSRVRLRGAATSLEQFTGGIYPFTVITDRVQVVAPPPWWSPRHIVLLAALGIGFFLAAQFLLHRVQTWHMRSVLREREQLALEMHDTLAQSFTGIAFQLQAASIERRGEGMIQTHIRNALEMVHVSHREASRTIAALRPQYRDAAGILEALRESAARLSDGGTLRIETVMNGKPAELPLEITDVFVRIGQEAISNAIQHSGCGTLTLSLTLARREAQLTIEDDGKGFDEPLTPQGLGIAGMRRRAAKVKARLELRTAPGEGTRIAVTAQLPVAAGLLNRLRIKLVTASETERAV
ncbi:Histidine kinase [Granulicella rosea]|uniref:Histidine kinase n=1 Tax=Granulicella rosea TaxID=474952 RepID=A0A239M3A3_9BACT|nr:ATP-binding protein [Granulicella rosea]SNT36618.1 Histidine kinase [Granulicella rosea]